MRIDNQTDRFVVEAAAGTTASADEVRMMLRTLLADRFKLASHDEARELPVFALVTTRRDRQRDAQLRRSGVECRPITPPAGVPVPPPPPSGMRGVTPLGPDRNLALRCGSMFFGGQISAREVTLDQLAVFLSRIVRRPVINRADLSGTFDIDLTYTPELQTPLPVDLPADPAPSLFTALQEQLGLRLEPQRAPVNVLVIDRVERPTEN